jgi:hypothetical protein
MTDTDRFGARFAHTGEAGPVLEEIDRLTAENERSRDPEREREILTLRNRAFALLDRTPGRESWPPALPDPFPDIDGIPELTTDQLQWETVAGAVLHHGAAIVRGLVGPERVGPLVDHIDKSFAAFDEWIETKQIPEDDPWFVPFVPESHPPEALGFRRVWVRNAGGVWAADLPRVTFEFMEAYRAAGLIDVVGGYFNEHPAVTVNKTVVRKVTPETFPSWHQDGAFMGSTIRSMNVWVALTDCGGDRPTPGLDIIPRRWNELLPTGTDGAMIDNAVGHDLVVRMSEDTPLIRPLFDAGDGLIFDELFLHRTATDEHMTENRYALESWFFAPSHCPEDYVPLVVR